MIRLFDKYFFNNKYVIAKIGGKENVERLLKSKWDFIFYTGSISVGKIIYQQAAKQLTPVVLELGGKSPCVVSKQPNMDLLIKRILWGKLTNCGQTCISPDYFLVDKNFGDEFVKLLIKTIKDFYGNTKYSNDYCRIVNSKAFRRLAHIIDNGYEYLEYGGEMDHRQKFIEPTILNYKDKKLAFLNSESMEGEIFGPIIPIYYYSDIQEVQEIINKYSDPLVAYLFTDKWKSIEPNIKAGSIVVNDTLIQMNSPLPFGGIGKSGIGQYHGKKHSKYFPIKDQN